MVMQESDMVKRDRLKKGGYVVFGMRESWSTSWHNSECAEWQFNLSPNLKCDSCNKQIAQYDLMSYGKYVREVCADAPVPVTGDDFVHAECADHDVSNCRAAKIYDWQRQELDLVSNSEERWGATFEHFSTPWPHGMAGLMVKTVTPGGQFARLRIEPGFFIKTCKSPGSEVLTLYGFGNNNSCTIEGIKPNPLKDEYLNVPDVQKVAGVLMDSSWEFPETIAYDVCSFLQDIQADYVVPAHMQVKNKNVTEYGNFDGLPHEMKFIWLKMAGQDTALADVEKLFSGKQFVFCGIFENKGELVKKISENGGSVLSVKMNKVNANTNYVIKGASGRTIYGKSTGPASKTYKKAVKKFKKSLVVLTPEALLKAIEGKVCPEPPPPKPRKPKRKASKPAKAKSKKPRVLAQLD